jgi:hypothetical protein
VSFTLPPGYRFDYVYVFAGSYCYLDYVNDGKPCYETTVIGNVVTVTKIGDGSQCKDISHVFFHATDCSGSTPTPAPTTTPALTTTAEPSTSSPVTIASTSTAAPTTTLAPTTSTVAPAPTGTCPAAVLPAGDSDAVGSTCPNGGIKVTGSTTVVSLTLEPGYRLDYVYVFAGSFCYLDYIDDEIPCYSTTQSGNVVTVTKIGDGSQCKNISHVFFHVTNCATSAPTATPAQ